MYSRGKTVRVYSKSRTGYSRDWEEYSRARFGECILGIGLGDCILGLGLGKCILGLGLRGVF